MYEKRAPALRWYKWGSRTVSDIPQYVFYSCCADSCRTMDRKTTFLRFLLLSSFQVFNIFTPLHGMQTRSYDENSVCMYACLSVKRVHCDKTEESYGRQSNSNSFINRQTTTLSVRNIFFAARNIYKILTSSKSPGGGGLA